MKQNTSIREYIVAVITDYYYNANYKISGDLVRCKDCIKRQDNGFCAGTRWSETRDDGFCDEGVSNDE